MKTVVYKQTDVIHAFIINQVQDQMTTTCKSLNLIVRAAGKSRIPGFRDYSDFGSMSSFPAIGVILRHAHDFRSITHKIKNGNIKHYAAERKGKLRNRPPSPDTNAHRANPAACNN